MKKPTNTGGIKSRSFTTKKRQPTEADIEVGASIRAHRLMARMSQQNLARKLGVTFQQIQKYEKGTNRIGAGRLPLIAEVLNVPITAFFKGAAPQRGANVPTVLVSDAATVRLLKAFAGITDSAIRRNISELVERIASTAKKKARR